MGTNTSPSRSAAAGRSRSEVAFYQRLLHLSPYSVCMALLRELSGHGRVVGGYLSGGAVLPAQNKSGDLVIQHHSKLFKRPRLNGETVTSWQELEARDGVAGAMGRAAAKAAVPGMMGKAVGAGLVAAMTGGHTVLIDWSEGQHSIIEFPTKQFAVFSVLLKDRQIVAPPVARDELPEPVSELGVRAQIAGLAMAALTGATGKDLEVAAREPDLAEQIAKLAALHAQGALTDSEFSEMKSALLRREQY